MCYWKRTRLQGDHSSSQHNEIIRWNCKNATIYFYPYPWLKWVLPLESGPSIAHHRAQKRCHLLVSDSISSTTNQSRPSSSGHGNSFSPVQELLRPNPIPRKLPVSDYHVTTLCLPVFYIFDFYPTLIIRMSQEITSYYEDIVNWQMFLHSTRHRICWKKENDRTTRRATTKHCS